LAARGNRLVRVRRFGVAFVATAAVALWSTLPASAQEAAPPAETTASETTPTAPAETTEPPPAPADPQPAPEQPPAEADPAPTTTTDGGTPKSTPPAPEATPDPDSTPAETTPADSTPDTKDAVKLEEPAPAAPAAPAPAAAAPTPAAESPSAAPPATTIVLIQDAPAAESAPAAAEDGTNAEAAVAAAALIVSFRPKPTQSAIALLPADEPAVNPRPSVRSQAGALKRPLRQQTCARPTARVPLSQRCKQARATAALRVNVTLAYVPSPEVRAAFARAGARVTVRKVEARPPPDSKAAKKHPIAEVRPTVPFGDSGQGLAKNGFNGSTGSSTWSSRLFALAAVPLRVPRPFRFARLRLPSTVPHGVIAAPPTARPG
jgi:hypothetical protein